MKIELDLPVPEGWRFVGIQPTKKGQGGCMSELNAFIDKYILELEQIRDEVKTFKEHAVEVVADLLCINDYDYEAGHKNRDAFRAEAKQLLGVR
jgi:hypothetical protein